MEPIPGFLERTLEVVQNLIDSILNNVLLEQEITEELFLGNY